MGKCVLGDGKSAYFWTDMWNDEECLHQKFNHLVTFAKNTELSIHSVIHTEYLEDLFHLPLSQQAFQEFEQLENLCEVALQRVQEGEADKWKYIWGNFSFTSRKAYKVLIGYQPTIPHFSWIWKTSCQARHKFFFWLLVLDRLNTRNLLKRKNFQLQSYSCEFPGCNEEETLEHLFQSCPFAIDCWDSVCPQRQRNIPFMDSIKDIKDKLQVPFSMDIIILASWSIWIVRNNKVFNNQRPSFNNWKAIFHEELRLLKFRIKNRHKEQFFSWLEEIT
jgi:hypothetical protein